MDKKLTSSVTLSKLGVFETHGGKVLHAMKKTDSVFQSFGEAYFSTIDTGVIRGWKRHRLVTCNIVVPIGKIRFVLIDSNENFEEFILSEEDYYRLTIPPMIWMGFQGVDKGINLLMNIADMVHDPEEADQKKIDEIPFNWG